MRPDSASPGSLRRRSASARTAKALGKLGNALGRSPCPCQAPDIMSGARLFGVRVMASMRHLTESAASGALRRGRGIEQFLEAFEEHGRRGLRYAYVCPAAR